MLTISSNMKPYINHTTRVYSNFGLCQSRNDNSSRYTGIIIRIDQRNGTVYIAINPHRESYCTTAYFSGAEIGVRVSFDLIEDYDGNKMALKPEIIE